ISGSTLVCIGFTGNFTSDGDLGGEWQTSDPGVIAVISTTGAVTALSPGTADIKYIFPSGCGSPDTASYTVILLTNVNAGTVPGSASLCVGGMETYLTDGDGSGVWLSSVPA